MGINSGLAQGFCAALMACGAALPAVCQDSARATAKSPTSFEEPQLTPTEMPLTATEKCKRTRHNTIYFSLVIDEQGAPQQIRLLSALGTDEDLFAVEAVRKDRFVPAREGGVARRVRRSMAVEVDTCVERDKDADGNKFDRLRLIALPKQTLEPARDSDPSVAADSGTKNEVLRVGGSISPPEPLITPEAIYTKDARRKKVQGECMITLIVDSEGFPRNPRIVRSLEPGLDQEALVAVRRYRFNPAMKKGVGPVPVEITIAVRYRLY